MQLPQLKQSVVKQVIKKVFLLYLLVAAAVTAMHISVEFSSTKKAVLQEMVSYESVFGSVLSAALWDFDREQMNSVMKGMLNIPVITAVKISQKGKVVDTLSRDNLSIEFLEKSSFAHEFPLVFKYGGINQDIGTATIYSNTGVVFDRVKVGYLFLIINAVLKGIALLLIFNWVGNRLLVEPLNKLTNEIKRIDFNSLKPLQLDLQVKKQNELSVIEKSFSTMVSELAKSKDEVIGLNKNLEAEIKKQTYELRAILNDAAEGIITFDDSHEIQLINPAALSIFDYGTEYASTHKLSIDDIIPNIGMNEDSLGVVQEKVGVKRGGDRFPIEISMSILDVESRQITTLIVRDITQRKKVESLKDEFVATVSHELRTPVTAILGSLSLIDGGAIKLSDEAAVSEMISVAKNNAERLESLVSEILDIQKLELGNYKLNLQSHDLMTLVKNGLEQNQGYADKYGVKVVLTDKIKQPVNVRADDHRVYQVIANLLSNAIKFSHENGTVDIVLVKAAKQVIIKIKDSGVGMADSFKADVFKKFAQEHAADNRSRGGTGLGLSISKVLVEKMGGTIGFDSKVDQGSTFYFSLPIDFNNLPEA